MDNSPARGTRDLLPATVAVRDHVLATITAVYHRYGYQRIETPALEDIQRLSGGQGGENEKLIYRVLRRGLDEVVPAGTDLKDLVDLGLRYDLTVPLTRFYGNNQASLPTPFRSFQFGPVWRAERPQKGRYRQFNQCDIDLIGEESVLAEVELIEATTEALAAVGLAGTTVRVSDRRFLAALAGAAGLPEEAWTGLFITLDKLDKVGWDGVRAELAGRGVDGARVDGLQATITGLRGVDPAKLGDTLADTVPGLADEVVADLAQTADALAALAGTREVSWEFDPTLVRGMGYYTGQIFEVAHPATSSSIAGGGRYDQLIGRSLGKDVPACGFSIGFERIVDLIDTAPTGARVAVLFEADVPLTRVTAVARELRADGTSVSPVRRRGKFGAQLGRLTEWGFTAFAHLKADTEGLPERRPLAG
ncbi:histidine--tRNA ligase [Actinokineospora bangkokensis]|uniref:Histidine--tRNA ligase n=1 Tax=Actinokineospora bangkokensis TaxID=1193682 RepID=A0A1Q9LSW9_9PSEU|nr:histidine--tRNA ligase [Actinokineospora bangkokensis]OLR95100.1 histidine--tRNA ligase [Actinokineospora bangkokensis]